MIDGALVFTEQFAFAISRVNLEADPVGFDDGVARRWVTRKSGGMGVKQLRRISEVGTSSEVTKNPDKLSEPRQYRTSAEQREMKRGYSLMTDPEE